MAIVVAFIEPALELWQVDFVLELYQQPHNSVKRNPCPGVLTT